ncbi:MAG: Asp-tRNA(Asn)/Glu-tRNA(Gln) amidotransferase subunit GatA [Candidatus Shapirobacteria bacterium]
MKLNELTIEEAKKGLRTGKFSCQELVKACLARIEEVDSRIKALVTVTAAEAQSQARLCDQQKDFSLPLAGIPLVIKDNFCTKGVKTTAAAKILAEYLPPYDATVIKRLKRAGAIILGKTNMDAWAHGSSTETSQFFTTRNPWDLTRLPGGSSGGSAAAVAVDETIGAIGSETAGSIRQPASWCGVVGFKPTYGRVSRYGLIAMASSLDCPGSITKTVKDAAVILQVIAGRDKKDATSSGRAVPNYLQRNTKQIKRLKIGFCPDYLTQNIDKKIVEATRQAITVFKKAGAEVKEVKLLAPKYAMAVYTILQRSEVSSNLARYDGIRYGLGRAHFGEEAKRRIMFGTYALSFGYYNQYYLKAQKVRRLLIEDFQRVFQEIDVLMAPTTPTTALPVGATKNEPLFGEKQDILVEPSALAGLPGISLPAGFDDKALPIGIQIIGPQFSEPMLLEAANCFEQETKFYQRKPKL